MSLYVADRGEKGYLREAWSARDFDFDQACRRWGRNDAFWVLCYRRHLSGAQVPCGAELNALVRRANVATGGRSRDGVEQRYTRHEARETSRQVSGYPSLGLLPLLSRRAGRRTRRETSVLEALRSVASACARIEFTASHRQLARMSGEPLACVGEVTRRLEKARMIWKVGETDPLPGREHGTTIWSLAPPRPSQRIDEKTPPTYDAKKMRWVWSVASDRGVVTRWMYAMQARRAQELYEAGRRRVPNVLITSEPSDLEESRSSVPICFQPRGGP